MISGRHLDVTIAFETYPERTYTRPMQNRPADSGRPSSRLTERQLERLIARAREDSAVLAVVLFGSAARGQATSASDVDVCLVLNPDAADEAGRLRLAYLAEVDLDVQVFQALPVYVRHRVLREGRVLLSKNDDLLYELAIKTAQVFEDFKPIYRRYLETVLDDRP
ncbi:MAG: nucleotidyltransferase domain-containing protein [Candidatus Rokuibacteriota bacterium]